MNLAVYSSESIHTMLELVNRTFSKIPNTKVKPATHEAPLPLQNHTGRIIVYRRLDNTKTTLSMYWQTPRFLGASKQCVKGFLLHLFNSRGEGSLYAYLQSQMLAGNVDFVEEYENMNTFFLFKLFIMVTEQGQTKMNEVIRAVFQFINIHKQMSKREFSKQWKNYIDIAQIRFDYWIDTSPYNFVK